MHFWGHSKKISGTIRNPKNVLYGNYFGLVDWKNVVNLLNAYVW